MSNDNNTWSVPVGDLPDLSHQTSNTDLREQVLKAAKVSKASVTFSQKIYSNNTEGPIETTNQEIVEIGIDDLVQLIEADKAAAVQAARLAEAQYLERLTAQKFDQLCERVRTEPYFGNSTKGKKDNFLDGAESMVIVPSVRIAQLQGGKTNG